MDLLNTPEQKDYLNIIKTTTDIKILKATVSKIAS